MFGSATPYVVAICTLLFCGLCALTLINIVEHFDPPEVRSRPEGFNENMAAQVTERVAV